MIRLIKKVTNFPRIWKASRYIEEAWDLAAREDFTEAEIMFKKGESLLRMLPYEYKIIKGYIKLRLKKIDESLNIFINAWEDVERNNRLSSEDKLYLKEYIYFTVKNYKKKSGVDTQNIIPVYVEEIPLDRVSDVWKRRFPCKNHPDWEC